MLCLSGKGNFVAVLSRSQISMFFIIIIIIIISVVKQIRKKAMECVRCKMMAHRKCVKYCMTVVPCKA